MNNYKETDVTLWTGRKSGQQLYLHEKVQFLNLASETPVTPLKKSFALLGYCCDDGVQRNQGRIGAVNGPDAIRRQLAKMPNHLKDETALFDLGSIYSSHGNMELAQEQLADSVTKLLEQKSIGILLGGGHDIAYGHYNGIKNHLGSNARLGIINFDAHFDLRSNENGNNSGTPFYQIAQDCKKNGSDFRYLCLGIRQNANDKVLFETAQNLGVTYLENIEFDTSRTEHVLKMVADFLDTLDQVYVTIDLDGFSSAFAPGVSAASPMGFSPTIVLRTLQFIMDSQKLIGMDIAEMNPEYDVDDQTAKLAASLVHFVMHGI